MSDLALPTEQAPRQIAAAAATYAERLADLRRAVAAEQSAQAGIEEARRLDVLALADARDAGSRKEPEREHERRAEAERDRASRSAQAEQLRFDRARDALLTAVSAHGGEWARRLERAWAKLDGDAAKALHRFQEIEAERAEVRSLALWVASLETAPAGHLEDALRRPVARYQQPFSQVPDARNANATLAVSSLVDGLHEHVAATSSTAYAAGADERAAVRAREDALAELRLNPQTAALATRVELTNELTLELALDVAAGRRDLEDALAQHHAEAAARREGRLQGSLPPA
jgi:hypothetical protein